MSLISLMSEVHSQENDSHILLVTYLLAASAVASYLVVWGFALTCRVPLVCPLLEKELHMYGIVDNKICKYFVEDDSLLHSFQGCRIAVEFFQKVQCWFNQTNNTTLKLNTQEVSLGMVTNKDRKLKELNLCFLFAKFLLQNKNQLTRPIEGIF